MAILYGSKLHCNVWYTIGSVQASGVVFGNYTLKLGVGMSLRGINKFDPVDPKKTHGLLSKNSIRKPFKSQISLVVGQESGRRSPFVR